jgi:RNA polymerase sigma-70 factor (ECF subfamily)
MYPDTMHQRGEQVPSQESKAWFVQAVEEKKHAMYRVALLMLRSDADAQDAVSEAVEATWRNFGKLRSEKALPSYLIRSAINASHGVLRRRRREVATEDFELCLKPSAQETPVWMYLGALKQKYRLPLMLRFAENMSDAEIAAALRLPRGTISSQIARGLKILKEQIEKEEEGRG